MPALEIKNLSINFGGVSALEKVSLDVGKSEFVGLLGPNGAGKTTVINCVSRIYDATAGSITFDGQDLLKMRGDQVLRVGVARTFQDLGFFNRISNMLVADYLKLGQFNPYEVHLFKDGCQFRESKNYELELSRRARKVLDFFRQVREHLEPSEEERQYPFLYGREGFPDLIDFEYGPIGDLSFAWRRRLDLARALVSGAKILLLDEPAQGLAPSEIDNLGKILKYIQQEFSVSSLIVEHNVEMLMTISDRIFVMNNGQVVLSGSPTEVIQNKEVIEIYLGSPKSVSTMNAQVMSSEKPILQNEISAQKEKPIIELINIDLYYGLAQALHSISLKIMPKQIVSILGTNGSGKSTLLKAISGLEKPSFGEILFKGEALPLGWPEVTVERGIQYVPQGHVIFPELTVLENLKLGAMAFESQGLDFKKGLEKVLSYFPSLKPALKLQAASLSGGQRQMVAIAQSVIGKSEVLLLDEPTLGLAPTLVETLFEVIERIRIEEDCTIVLVEQNVAKALEISQYIFMMSSGILVAEGTSQQLKENDQTIKRYLGFR